MKIAILGPKYSYCHIAAMQALDGNFVFCTTIEEIFRKVSNGEAEKGVAPFENLLQGSVRDSFFALVKYKIRILNALDMPIHHCLASRTNNYKIIISHPQALGQCAKFIQKQGKKTEEAGSTSQAMEKAEGSENYAAIGSEQAAVHYGLKIINKNTEDNRNNVTRFILISKKENKSAGRRARTSMLLHSLHDRPGVLCDILSCFKEKNINLTKIESLPTGKKIGDYLFFIEIDGNANEKRVKSALAGVKKMAELHTFGSYEVKKLE